MVSNVHESVMIFHQGHTETVIITQTCMQYSGCARLWIHSSMLENKESSTSLVGVVIYQPEHLNRYKNHILTFVQQ